MKEFNAMIKGMHMEKVVLDKTAFYPAGGGQPNDKGKLTINGMHFDVVDLEYMDDDIVHILDRAPHALEGAHVKGVIDWDYRYACMRYHSALHTIDGVLGKYFGNSGLITGNQIYHDRARMDIDMQGLTTEKAQEIIDKTNEVLKEGHNITTRVISREEALKIPSLSRTEPGRKLIQRLDNVRVVEIEGVDTQADGGTHVKNTKEIGTIVLSNYENKGSKRKRIEIVLK